MIENESLKKQLQNFKFFFPLNHYSNFSLKKKILTCLFFFPWTDLHIKEQWHKQLIKRKWDRKRRNKVEKYINMFLIIYLFVFQFNKSCMDIQRHYFTIVACKDLLLLLSVYN